MAGKATAMDVKLAAAISGAVRRGEVAAFCREQGISRQTFYKWRRRYVVEGRGGLEDRSRRPQRSPSAVPLAVETEVVRLRKELADFGGDAGPWTIRQHLLADSTLSSAPSEATLWRILVRRGLIVPDPKKRPRVSWRRFVWERPNDMWQIDATHFELVDGTVVEIVNLIDDHSRACMASIAVPTCTSVNAWNAVVSAGQRWGLPARLLSDNARAFNSSRHGRTVSFEANLRAVGITPIVSTPYHPQTCGKVERFHQTLKRWLTQQPPPNSLHQLRTLLERYVEHYNQHRPHRALGGATPADTWAATPRATPTGHPITDTTTVIRRIKVNNVGAVRIPHHSINVGIVYAGLTLDVIITGIDCIIFHNHQLVRALTINPDRYWQPSGRPTGGTRQPRLTQ
jgi:transposase InsO family protein